MKNTSYVSELSQFINTMLDQPSTHEQQMKLRGTWWDKDAIDLDEQKAYHEAEVKHDPYVYFTYTSSKK